MIDGLDVWQTARDGARAIADGDGGRSAHLMNEIAETMRDLSVGECEWLSIAVTNGAFGRQMGTTNEPPGDVSTQKTAEGEIWDI